MGNYEKVHSQLNVPFILRFVRINFYRIFKAGVNINRSEI